VYLLDLFPFRLREPQKMLISSYSLKALKRRTFLENGVYGSNMTQSLFSMENLLRVRLTSLATTQAMFSSFQVKKT
jgi:hypothetical protein